MFMRSEHDEDSPGVGTYGVTKSAFQLSFSLSQVDFQSSRLTPRAA